MSDRSQPLPRRSGGLDAAGYMASMMCFRVGHNWRPSGYARRVIYVRCVRCGMHETQPVRLPKDDQ